MQSLLFVFSVILLAQPLLGFPTPQKGVPVQCGDPTFACQDIQSARSCGVVKTCIHDVWATMNVPDDNDQICDICKEMVKEARDQLLSNMTQEEIKEVFEGSCKLLPVKIIAEGCIKIVDEIIPELVEMLASRMDPNMVCTVSGMCFPSKKIAKKESVKDELTCEFCEHILEHIKDLITTNTTMDEFKNALLNFCKQTGKFSDKCTTLVNGYYDMLFSYIKNLNSKGMCTLMGVCNNSEHPLIKLIPGKKIPQNLDSFPLVRLVPAKFLEKEETNDIFQSHLPVERMVGPLSIFEQDTECALCKALSFYLESDLSGDRSEEEVKRTLDGMCEKWMKEFPEPCNQMINKYAEKIQSSVVGGISFEELCSVMKACPIEKDNSKEMNIRVVSPKVGHVSSVEESPFCDLCKDTLTKVEKQLQDPAMKEKLEDVLGQVCNFFPKSLQDDCSNFINQNIDVVIMVLEAELKPNTFCPAVGLCPRSSRLGVTSQVKDLECDLCKDLIKSLRQTLESKESREMVENFLNEGCARLPDQYAEQCKKFVKDNFDTLLTIIVSEMDPQKMCSFLSVCPGKSVLHSFFMNIHKAKDVECDLCKNVVGKVEDMIKDKRTEEEIKQALDTVCSYLPSSMVSKCQEMVNKYSETIITLLMEELDPDVVCAELNLCPTNARLSIDKSKAQDIECQGCQYALHFLQERLMDAQTQVQIKLALKEVCSLMPELYQHNCEAFVDEYGSSVLVLLAQEIDPSQLCFRLNMCQNHTSIFEKVLEEISLNHFRLDKCSVCTTVVDYMDKLVEKDDVDKEITHLVEKVCHVLPTSFQEQCSTIIETYGSYILQMIGQSADSKEVCQDIDFCPKSQEHRHLLGGRKCTFGPSYWCISKDHASSCKAESYCTEKVWKN